MRNIAGPLLVALLFASSAFAQSSDEPKQTPENAQRFLATVLPGMDFVDHRLGDVIINATLGEHYALDGRRWTVPSASELSRFSRNVRTYDIRGVTQGNSACSSELRLFSSPVTYTPPTVRTYSRGNYSSPWTPSPLFLRREANTTLVLDWRKVTSARSEGASVSIATSQGIEQMPWGHAANGRPELRLNLTDEGMAARVAYAAEFLRLSCDPTADTGF
jgi:hypothetical protein